MGHDLSWLNAPTMLGEDHRRHRTYVQKRVGHEFFAVCESGCGCHQFPDRQRLADAEADARDHGHLRHVYDRDELVEHEAKDRLPLSGEPNPYDRQEA